MAIINRIGDFQGEMTAWRRDLHAHPEIGFEETRTAAVVADKLRAFGLDEVHTGLAKTGVVGVLKAGSGGRAIGLRADMDALPIEEATGLPYASSNRRPDARLRPRRPHRDAARRRQLSGRDAQLRRHRVLHLPARRGDDGAAAG